MDDERIGEILDRTEKLSPHGSEYWVHYIEDYFCKLDMNARMLELADWQRKLDRETSPSRETAGLISKYRQLSNLHDLLLKASR